MARALPAGGMVNSGFGSGCDCSFNSTEWVVDGPWRRVGRVNSSPFILYPEKCKNERFNQ